MRDLIRDLLYNQHQFWFITNFVIFVDCTFKINIVNSMYTYKYTFYNSKEKNILFTTWKYFVYTSISHTLVVDLYRLKYFYISIIWHYIQWHRYLFIRNRVNSGMETLALWLWWWRWCIELVSEFLNINIFGIRAIIHAME